MIKGIFLILILFLSACTSEPKQKFNAKQLIHDKCAACHNLDLPPKNFKNEIAPPMMAISFHLVGFMQGTDENIKTSKAIEFVKDYVMNPSADKAFCDEKSLQDYGLMPSQKGKLTEDELEAIAKYMFSYYTQEKLAKAQKQLNAFNQLSDGEKIARKYNCLTCHKVDKNLVGPSFVKIADRYKDDAQTIKDSITQGSKKKWLKSKNIPMPAFKQLTEKDLETLTKWILEQK